MLTTTEAARALGIKPSALMVRRGRLAKRGVQVGTVQFGGVIGWSPEDMVRVAELGKAGRPRKTTAAGAAKDRTG
jgi:hypothetical protein